MRFRGSLAARVALLTTLAVGFFVASVAAAAYVTVRHQLVASLDASLYERADTLADVDVEVLTDGGTTAWLLGAADIHYAVLDDDGDFITQDVRGQDQIELGQSELDVAQGRAERSARTVTSSGDRYRVVAVPGPVPGTAMILAQSLEPTQDALKQLGFLLTLAGLAGVIAAGFAGWAVAQQGLTPVRRLSSAVEQIARTQKLDPIPVEGTDDEVATLAMTFNRMLAALSASQDRQRRLVADAGHELRTPLTSLRTNLDLLAQADARGGGLSPESRAELMDDVRFQIDELTTLIGDLTELARDEPIPSQLEPVDVADVVEHALARVRRRAGGVGFDVAVEPWRVTGEAAALERAVTNLLDNAVKWSPPGGTVTVRLENGVLYVADQGEGIAEEDLPHVFERFYRSSESRTMPGSGLGLSIVRAIVERHGGMVRAGAAPGGGAAFWTWLPPLQPAPAEPAGSEAKS